MSAYWIPSPYPTTGEEAPNGPWPLHEGEPHDRCRQFGTYQAALTFRPDQHDASLDFGPDGEPGGGDDFVVEVYTPGTRRRAASAGATREFYNFNINRNLGPSELVATFAGSIKYGVELSDFAAAQGFGRPFAPSGSSIGADARLLITPPGEPAYYAVPDSFSSAFHRTGTGAQAQWHGWGFDFVGPNAQPIDTVLEWQISWRLSELPARLDRYRAAFSVGCGTLGSVIATDAAHPEGVPAPFGCSGTAAADMSWVTPFPRPQWNDTLDIYINPQNEAGE